MFLNIWPFSGLNVLILFLISLSDCCLSQIVIHNKDNLKYMCFRKTYLIDVININIIENILHYYDDFFSSFSISEKIAQI